MTDLLLKILDLLLGGLISKFKERVRLKNEFEGMKRKIIYAGIVNDLPVLLNEFRDFLINKNLIEKKNIGEFFSKWLTNPIVMAGVSAANAYSSEQIASLKNEITQLKL